MKIIIFDFEVFKHDVLLGAKILYHDSEEFEIFQTWDQDEIREFYEKYKEHIWIGWNNEHYDNLILQAVVRKINPKLVNDRIIKEGRKMKLNLPLMYFDVMKTVGFFSLGNTEALAGKKISESEVDFELDRPLTDEERRLTEEYNKDDLEQTLYNFKLQQEHLLLRLETLKEFDLPIRYLNLPESMIAEKVLMAEKIEGIENMVVKPKIHDQMHIKNEKVRKFFLEEEFLTKRRMTTDICGVKHVIALGGIHGARSKYYTPRALYFDVSGYYNLIMINYNLLPRSISPEGRELYIELYHQQLALREINPLRRAIYKLILLTVFGSTLNKWLNFYDPYHGRLITLTGQLFLVDLLEKLEDYVELVQSNTDGIIVVPNEGVSDEKIVEIVQEWQDRTGFTLKIEHIEDVYQRDVNCYMYRKGDKIVTIGGDMKDWEKINVFSNQPEPRIVGRAIVEFLMNGKFPEETVYEFKNEIEMFQYIARKGTFKWVELEVRDIETDEVISIEKVQNINRAFASNNSETNSKLYKVNPDGKQKRVRMPVFPENIFVYNDEILSKEVQEKLVDKINYEHYVTRSYEKIAEFIDIPTISKFEIW